MDKLALRDEGLVEYDVTIEIDGTRMTERVWSSDPGGATYFASRAYFNRNPRGPKGGVTHVKTISIEKVPF